MKDSEKGLLALALVGVYLYSSKKKPLTPVPPPGGFKTRKEEEIFVRSMTPQQREAYMAEKNITSTY